jgi:hypothetical protein
VNEEESEGEIDLDGDEVGKEEAGRDLVNLLSAGESNNTNKAYKTQKKKYLVYLKKKEQDEELLPQDLTDAKMANYVAQKWREKPKVPQYRLARSMFHNELVNLGKPSFNTEPPLPFAATSLHIDHAIERVQD